LNLPLFPHAVVGATNMPNLLGRKPINFRGEAGSQVLRVENVKACLTLSCGEAKMQDSIDWGNCGKLRYTRRPSYS
jgi:hypothetical protein